MAMRLPMDSELVPRERLPESFKAHLLVVFKRRGFPRDDAARKNDADIHGAGCLGLADQCILSCSAWSHHQKQPAGPDRRPPSTGNLRHVPHPTRRPSRQTLRTTGTSRATCTRIRSARLPTAISPRSARPTASAGVLLTVRTADAKSIAGTCRGNCRAAISRLEGM